MSKNPFLDPGKEIQQGKSDEEILARHAAREQDDEQEPANAAVPSGVGAGLVYAMGDEIWLHRERGDDIHISTHLDDWVRALCVHDGELYHAGVEGNIYETLSGKAVARREGPVNALVSHAGRLVDGGEYDEIFDTFSNSVLAAMNRLWRDGHGMDAVNAFCSFDHLPHQKLYVACGRSIIDVTTKKTVASRADTVAALCSHVDKLYDAGEDGFINETFGAWHSRWRGGWVLTLCSHQGRIYDGGRYDGVFDTFSDTTIPHGGSSWVRALCAVGDTFYHGLEVRDVYNTSTGQMIARHDSKNCEAMCSVDQALVDEIVRRFR